MKIPVLQFDAVSGKHYTLSKSSHLYDKRGDSWFHRDQFINKSDYSEIIKLAIQNGLTSFRHKGAVVIHFFDYNKRPFSILLTLDEKDWCVNDIFIISVFKGNMFKPYYTHYIKAKHRIYLSPEKFTLSYKSKKDRDKMAREGTTYQIDDSAKKEDQSFKDAMSGIKRV